MENAVQLPSALRLANKIPPECHMKIGDSGAGIDQTTIHATTHF
jgi:hypothetical protein